MYITPLIVTCPVRLTPDELVNDLTLTVPEPVTGIAVGVVLFTISQSASDAAVQLHVESGAVTVMTQFASLTPTVFDAASRVTVPHTPGLRTAASCVTVNVWPATMTLPLRASALLAPTLYVTVPLPVPDEVPALTVNQLVAETVADQLQLESDAVTANDPLPPSDA